MTIPVSIIVVTKNEEAALGRCLAALRDFEEVIVVDSSSTDRTVAIAQENGARALSFSWDGRYPKKRQWCLDHLDLKYDWIFFVDADEVVTPELVREISGLDFKAAGYFIIGRYVIDGRVMRFGLSNRKLALFDRRRMMFPVVDDLDLPGMGEIEGHYQPVLKPGHAGGSIGVLRSHLLHHACEDRGAWLARHRRYAAWERAMNARGAWPEDPVPFRQALKRVFRALPGRPLIAFFHCYIIKLGILDGARGVRFAKDRYLYYSFIAR